MRQIEAYTTSTPPAHAMGDPFEQWWIREETVHEHPSGLAVLNVAVEPPALPSPDWDLPYPEEKIDRYMFTLAAELSVGGATFVSAYIRYWYEYVDGTAVSLVPPRELPIGDLLAEVHEGLRLMGRE